MMANFGRFAVFCLLAVSGRAAVNSVASLANPLDNHGGGARALGMGSAFVGVADDSSALFWNPAGLSGLDGFEAALHHNSWLAGIIQETLVVGLPLGPLGGVGASLNYINYGSLSGYDDSGSRNGEYSANRYGVGLGWGLHLLPGLSVGIAVKGSVQTIADSSYSTVGVDLGALWQPWPRLRLGLAYANLSTQIGGYQAAAALRGGASYLLYFERDNQLLLAASASLEPQGVHRLQVGVEDRLYERYALRLGYQAVLTDNRVEGWTGLTAGLGVSGRSLSLDYAYLPFGGLGDAHRISLAVKFGS